MSLSPLAQALANLPPNSKQAILVSNFMGAFMEALKFSQQDCIPNYKTSSKAADAVDIAARYPRPNLQPFLYDRENPDVLIEIKPRDYNLESGSSTYKTTVNQLKRYLLGDKSRSVQWGIITNSVHVQLFRKHGKVIFPVTQCLEMTTDTIDQVVGHDLLQHLQHPSRALVVSVYNNKGGVGKTTTVINLASVLNFLGFSCLVIDFDPNQRDLTESLGVKSGKVSFFDCLEDDRLDIHEAIVEYRHQETKTGKLYGVDVLPIGDNSKLDNKDVGIIAQKIGSKCLQKVVDILRPKYDYIFIDTPPNWQYFCQESIYASDVVLMPVRPNSVYSIDNAALVIQRYIPEVQAKRSDGERSDGGPAVLPIFFNGEKTSAHQHHRVKEYIDELIGKYKKEHKFDLLPYFFPHSTSTKKNNHIFELENHAAIAGSSFSRRPAVYTHKKPRELYRDLAREYFIQ